MIDPIKDLDRQLAQENKKKKQSLTGQFFFFYLTHRVTMQKRKNAFNLDTERMRLT